MAARQRDESSLKVLYPYTFAYVYCAQFAGQLMVFSPDNWTLKKLFALAIVKQSALKNPDKSSCSLSEQIKANH